jgi:hypothetical protein
MSTLERLGLRGSVRQPRTAALPRLCAAPLKNSSGVAVNMKRHDFSCTPHWEGSGDESSCRRSHESDRRYAARRGKPVFRPRRCRERWPERNRCVFRANLDTGAEICGRFARALSGVEPGVQVSRIGRDRRTLVAPARCEISIGEGTHANYCRNHSNVHAKG